MESANAPSVHGKRKLRSRIWARRYCYLMLIPVAAYFIIFHYMPMWGLIISFQDYKVFKGILGSPWVGLKNYTDFIYGRQFVQVIRNTLLLNELRSRRFCRVVQTITYMPHFISTVVVVSMMNMLLSPTTGIVNQLIMRNGGAAIYFMNKKEWFRPLSIISGLWQGTGWNSIIYLAAISGIDPGYYEAATIDGATQFQKIRYITLPCIQSTIIIMFIMRMGQMLNSDFQKVLLMQTSGNRSVSQLISTYVYERGIQKSDYGYATAVQVFNSVISLILVLLSNRIIKHFSGEALF